MANMKSPENKKNCFNFATEFSTLCVLITVVVITGSSTLDPKLMISSISVINSMISANGVSQLTVMSLPGTTSFSASII